MTDETLFLIGDVIMALSILGVLVFVLSYGIFFPWWQTQAGKALMFFALSLSLWGAQSFIARLDPDYWGRPWTRIVIYLLIFVTIWGLVATLWRYRNRPFHVIPPDPEENKEKK